MLRTLKFIIEHPLNKGGELAALGRFARWQIMSRIAGGARTVPFVNDTVLVMERGMTGATGNWYCGLHEHVDMGFLLHFLRKGDLFLDIGANVGSYTVLAAGAVGAKVAAFEPIPSTFRKLERNIEANRLNALVDAYNVGLGDEEGRLLFSSGSDTMNHVVTEDEARTIPTVEVPVKRVDDVVTGIAPRLAKIDVEGWEAHVLKGLTRILDDPDLAAVIMETNESSDRYRENGQDEAEAIMVAAGFKACAYDPFKREIVEGEGAENTIFVRDFDSVRERVASAPRFALINGEI